MERSEATELMIEAVQEYRAATGNHWGGPPYTEAELEAGRRALANRFVVHCKRSEYDVYIGRGKCPKTGIYWGFGNIFEIGRDGTREDVIRKYRAWVYTQPHLLEAARRTLKGKVLGCWCSPQACHGDVLAEIANT